MWPFRRRKMTEWTPTTYGIFKNEIDPVLELVEQHAPLAEIEGKRCPLCGSHLVVHFENDTGTEYTVLCTGEPVHFSFVQKIADPPSWWRERYQPPKPWKEYARGSAVTTDAGSLLMFAHGWSESKGHWTGHFKCFPLDDEFSLWTWIVSERTDLPEYIDDSMLAGLRAEFDRAHNYTMHASGRSRRN